MMVINMLRTIIWFLYFWVSLLALVPMMLHGKWIKNEKDKTAYADKLARRWAGHLLYLAGVRVEVVGRDKIPEGTAVVYVSNHQSNFDIPLMITQMPKEKGFIAKLETQKLPLVRTWMTLLKCIFIDRSDIRQQVKAISKGVEQLKDGHSMIIFPEGTRSKTGEFLEFKPGSLKLATKSGVPIVPVVIVGSMKIMPKGRLRIKPARVTMVVCDPIAVLPEHNKDTVALAQQIRQAMEQAYALY